MKKSVTIFPSIQNRILVRCIIGTPDLDNPEKDSSSVICSASVSSSLVSSKPKAKEKNPLASCFGAWNVDETKYSTKELVDDIHAMMEDSNDIEGLKLENWI